MTKQEYEELQQERELFEKQPDKGARDGTPAEDNSPRTAAIRQIAPPPTPLTNETWGLGRPAAWPQQIWTEQEIEVYFPCPSLPYEQLGSTILLQPITSRATDQPRPPCGELWLAHYACRPRAAPFSPVTLYRKITAISALSPGFSLVLQRGFWARDPSPREFSDMYTTSHQRHWQETTGCYSYANPRIPGEPLLFSPCAWL